MLFRYFLVIIAAFQIFILQWHPLDWVLPTALDLHHWVKHVIDDLHSPWSWFYEALLIGEDGQIRKFAGVQAFLILGLYHLIVVSGGHLRALEDFFSKTVSFMPIFLKKTFKCREIQWHLHSILIFFLLLAFTVINRFDASCSRALIQWSFLKWPRRAHLNGADREVFVTLLALLIEPKWVSSLSFQLSAAASLGLTMASSFDFQKKWQQRLLSALFCTALTAPFLFRINPCLSWLVIPANVVALPVFEIFMIPASLLGITIPFLLPWADRFIGVLMSTAEFLARFDQPYFCHNQERGRLWGPCFAFVFYVFWRFSLSSVLAKRFQNRQRQTSKLNS